MSKYQYFGHSDQHKDYAKSSTKITKSELKYKTQTKKTQKIINNTQKLISNTQIQKRRNKSSQFHKSIAKSQRQQIFRKGRQAQQIKYTQSQMIKLAQQLNSKRKRQKFIEMVLLILKGQPNQNWREGINYLLWSLQSFYMNEQMSKWIRLGIVDKICMTFEKKYRGQQLWGKGSQILQKILFLQPKCFPYILGLGKRGRVIKRVFQCSLLEENIPLRQFTNCVELISTMMAKDCRQRGVKCCIKWLQRMLDQKGSTQKALNKVYRVLAYLSGQISRLWASFPKQIRFLVQKMLDLLNQTVQLHQGDDNHQKLLIIINNLTLYNIYSNPQKPQQNSMNLSPNLPLCIVLTSKQNILNKIISMTPKQLKQTVNMVIRILKYSVEYRSQPKQLHQILSQYLQQSKRKSKFLSNKKSSHLTISLINNLISYLLIIYNKNTTPKSLIQKIHSFFKTITQKISQQKSKQNQNNNESQNQQPEEIQI